MNLYSLQYIEHSFNLITYFHSILTAFIALVMIISGIFYYRNQNNPRFRSLFILVSMIGALIIAMQAGRLIDQQNSDSKTSETVQLIKKVAKDHHVSTNQIYSSSTTLADGMTLQIGKKYYTVSFNGDQSSYSLAKTNLVNQPHQVKSADFSFGSAGGTNGEMDYWDIALKFIVGLITIVLQINLSGKGNLAPSNAIDQVQNYILGGIIGGTIYNSQITNLQFIVIMLIWSVIVFTIKFLTSQNTTLNKLINGSPQVLISNGIINVRRALKNGVTASELTFKLRTHGVNDIKDVQNATLEQNGQLTVNTYDDDSVSYPLISDGQLNPNSLKREGITEEQLNEMLQAKHTNISNVYLAQMNDHTLDIVKYPSLNRIFKIKYPTQIKIFNKK
ncbi:DUF3290 family protein [Fructilactobacillus sanfranciscensis]|uniref:DUF3290 family protein n=1 Tax=Fructilactobacillus sanfranciscensis TaxID=1625 RepID=UPI0012EC3C37|nr:DUF3290 family protein [Fructilactobacillus sanfranciscensis]MVF16241.1 DUF3290 family protein [Fructilactobacillus sanfranciscensis]